jgi:sporulation protein YlmC with PRC-barrel domain
MMKSTLAACFVATTMLAGSALAQGTNFVTEQTASQWRASKLVGVDVYGTDNAKIGDVSEVLMDAQGNAQAVVIGVGGFLGIGEKNVAVPFSAIQWKNEPMTTASTTAPAAPRGDVSATGTAAAPAPSPTGPASASNGAARGYPDHGTLAMTKADLQSAPDFKYYGATQSTSAAPSSATAPAGGMSSPMGGAGTAPAPKP